MRKYTLKNDFKTIDNQDIAYILGFIYADGYIMEKPRYRLGINLATRDYEILEKIRDIISPSQPISRDEKSVYLVICGKEIFENLEKWGVYTRKTSLEMSIPKIDENLIRHFIRGYFDGDGWVSAYKEKYIYAGICSPTINILKCIQNQLSNNKILSRINKEKRIGKEAKILNYVSICKFDKYTVSIKKRESIEKLYHYLYDEANLFLKRKKDIFDKVLKTKLERNSIDNEFLEYKGKIQNIDKWAKDLNLSVRELRHRLSNPKWTLEDSLSFKKFENKKNLYCLKGEDSPIAKFTNNQVIEIFKSEKSILELSKEHNVHKDTIYRIKKKINYKSVTKDL